ncbi:hypothetical protein V2P20_10745 [Methylobacter sp. Wu1]|uniref:hypothetical protein n=1 Tax=Methylobacter sp. Wu1 TaxID=3119359 RepID=UPI002F95E50D
MGNWFAYTTLALWPLISIRLYRTKTVQAATLWTLLGGFMFLPVGTSVDLPMIPPFDKNSIPVLSAFLGCWFVTKRRVSILSGRGWVKWLVILFIIEPFITAELNSDAIFIGGRFLPGMTSYDALSAMVNQFIIIIPFFIGRQLFKTCDNQLLMFKALALAGLGYSVLMLFEVRMSPQLHTWVYGYFPHSFGQQMRYGGYRPVVFIGHGLRVAFFAAITLTSAVVIWQLKDKIRQFSSAGVAYYLLLVLILCKSVASTMYGFAALLLIKLASIKNQLRIATFLVLIALLYPTMSIMNIFPHQALIEWAASVDADRAQSLGFRFDNEHKLLEHGQQRFFFGWGSWGRNRVYNQENGKDESVTDGRWIITFGQFGWLGFIAEFGLLAIPIFSAVSVSKLVKSRQELIMLAAHALLASLVIIDQLPNSSLSPWVWLLVGILLGRSEALLQKYREYMRSSSALL